MTKRAGARKRASWVSLLCFGDCGPYHRVVSLITPSLCARPMTEDS